MYSTQYMHNSVHSIPYTYTHTWDHVESHLCLIQGTEFGRRDRGTAQEIVRLQYCELCVCVYTYMRVLLDFFANCEIWCSQLFHYMWCSAVAHGQGEYRH